MTSKPPIKFCLAAAFTLGLQVLMQDPVLAAPTNAAYTAALKGLAEFTNAITTQNVTRLGLSNITEVPLMTLGEPLRVSDLGVGTLLRLRPPYPRLDVLLTNGSKSAAVFPVTVNQTVRSSIAVRKQNTSWRATEFGGPNRIRHFTNARQAAADVTHLPLSAFVAVNVEPLQAYFLAYPATNQLMMVPIFDEPDLQLAAGSHVPAAVVVPRLIRAARKFGNYPL